MDLPPDVGRDIQRLNALFQTQRTLCTKLEAITELVQHMVARCDAASVSLTVEESMFTGAASSQLAIEADLVQYRLGEGPCLTSAAGPAVIRIDVLAHDERFAHFAPGAVEMGIESVLSIPLASGDRTVGSLNLYSRTTDAFDEVPARIDEPVAYAAQLVADSPFYAASAETLARMVEALRQATQVEIAVGMLIFDGGLSAADAWEHLRDLATRAGTTMAACAERLIDAHERAAGRPEGPEPGSRRAP